jgi:hypothetical protein
MRTKWVEVPEPLTPCTTEEEDEKHTNPRQLLRAHPALARGIKANQPIKAYLSYYFGTSGAANTAFAAAFSVLPSQDSSWTSWQATFDEVKVVGAEAIWNTFHTVDPSGLPANSSNTIMVYDPTSSVTLASVNAGLQFEHYQLCRNMVPTSSGPKVSPAVYTKDGFNHFRAKIPKAISLSTTQTLNSTGMWRPTADASSYDWGQFLTYTSVGGTSAVLRVEVFVRMLCEFRVRR